MPKIINNGWPEVTEEEVTALAQALRVECEEGFCAEDAIRGYITFNGSPRVIRVQKEKEDDGCTIVAGGTHAVCLPPTQNGDKYVLQIRAHTFDDEFPLTMEHLEKLIYMDIEDQEESFSEAAYLGLD